MSIDTLRFTFTIILFAFSLSQAAGENIFVIKGFNTIGAKLAHRGDNII